MLPKSHILLGAILAIIIWVIIPQTPLIYLAIFFLASFLISLEDYKIFSSKKKSDFRIFHTIEFHVLIGLLALLWIGFFYLFIGMIFHSLINTILLIRKGAFRQKEFFFFNWAIKKVRQNS